MLGGPGGQLDGLLGMPRPGVPVLQAGGGLRPLHRHIVALQSGGWRPRARGDTGWREASVRGGEACQQRELARPGVRSRPPR